MLKNYCVGAIVSWFPTKVPLGSSGLLLVDLTGKGREPGNQRGQNVLEAIGWRRVCVAAIEAKLQLQGACLWPGARKNMTILLSYP